ncbi:hypothetical protein L2K20_25965 [Mycobacterium sp. MBM]|nr:hypothetical protein [Mycobacterium sp. MBM]
MGQPYRDEYDDVDGDFGDDDEITPRPSIRGAVGIFLLGWLFLPTAGVLLSELASPWFEVAALVTLLFIAVFVVSVVRVVKNF